MAVKKATKKMRGKSTPREVGPTYKPSLYLHDSNIPAVLKNVKPGAKVSLTLTAKVSQRSEGPKGVSSLDIEIESIGAKKRRD